MYLFIWGGVRGAFKPLIIVRPDSQFHKQCKPKPDASERNTQHLITAYIVCIMNLIITY